MQNNGGTVCALSTGGEISLFTYNLIDIFIFVISVVLPIADFTPINMDNNAYCLSHSIIYYFSYLLLCHNLIICTIQHLLESKIFTLALINLFIFKRDI